LSEYVFIYPWELAGRWSIWSIFRVYEGMEQGKVVGRVVLNMQWGGGLVWQSHEDSLRILQS
jgi:hypothetical protein